MKSIRAIQALIILVPVILFGWLLWQELVPTGTFIMERVAGTASPFIDRLLPDGRVQLADPHSARPTDTITGDPAFFFVHPHRGFESGEVEIRFQNTGVPIVEFGGLAREEGQVYDLTPIQNRLIDTSTWTRHEEQGITLLEREPKFATIADFLANPPPRHEISTYHYRLARAYRMPGYVAQGGTRNIDVSLRGFHEFETYLKNEPLSFTFSYTDENRGEGPDPFEVIVFNENNEAVTDVHVADDGNTGDDARPSRIRTATVSLALVPEGTYKLEIRVGTDIFLRSIQTSANKLVAMNTIILGDEVGYKPVPSSVRMWTESKTLAFETTHAEGVQSVEVGANAVALATPFTRVEYDVKESGVVRITVPKGDARVFGDGHYAFAPDQFFNPDPVRLNATTNLDRLGVNYVIAAYTPPVKDPSTSSGQGGEWLVARVPFNTEGLVQLNGTWKFAFSLPGIERTGGAVNVRSVSFTMHRAPLTISVLMTLIRSRL